MQIIHDEKTTQPVIDRASEWDSVTYGECPKHGRFIDSITRYGYFRMLPCPKCVEETKKRKEQEEAARRIEKNLQRAAIPIRFKTKTIGGYEAAEKGQKEAKEVCARWLEDIPGNIKNGVCIVFCGRPGTGKTHLACAVANKVLESGFSAVFTSASDIVRSVRATWRGEGSEQSVIRDFSSVDLLIIDEVGAQQGTENENQILFSVLNSRYEAMKPTFVLSNLTPSGLKQFIGERSFDRLREGGGHCLSFTWQSHRGAGSKRGDGEGK